MRELGLRYVRIAEFAWSRIEPRPEAWQWDWLDDAIAVLAAEGSRVVLCTPTATPPAWLIRQHPGDSASRPAGAGSRLRLPEAL